MYTFQASSGMLVLLPSCPPSNHTQWPSLPPAIPGSGYLTDLSPSHSPRPHTEGVLGIPLLILDDSRSMWENQLRISFRAA